MTNVKVTKSDPPESKEILAEAVVKISDGFYALQRSGLNKRAIIVLLQAETRLSMKVIRTVLDALPRLKGWYCR